MVVSYGFFLHSEFFLCYSHQPVIVRIWFIIAFLEIPVNDIKCLFGIGPNSIRAKNHFVEFMLCGSFAAFFQSLFHVVSVAPYVNLAEITVPPGKCKLHTGICDAGFHCECVVFLVNVH